jgi:hypothetical protein
MRSCAALSQRFALEVGNQSSARRIAGCAARLEAESKPGSPSSPVREAGTAAVPARPVIGATQSMAWSVERKGLEWVGDHERRGSPRVLFWPWAAQGINVIIVAFGMYVAGLGLGWLSATVAAAVGAVLSFLLVGLASLAGQQGGAPTMVTSVA